MNNDTPWHSIKRPENNLQIREEKNSNGIERFWAKDKYNRYIFIIQLEGDFQSLFLKKRPIMKGFTLDLRTTDTPKKQAIWITLEDKSNEDIFYSLCLSLNNIIDEANSSRVGFNMILNHLDRWKMFLSNQSKSILSPHQIRGLLSELYYLKHLLLKSNREASSVISSWQGPEKTSQDFILENKAIEVKSMLGRDRDSVKISSEDQLQDISDKLFLVVYLLQKSEPSEIAFNLNKLVLEIESQLDSISLQEFQNTLNEAGYEPNLEYGLHNFTIKEYGVYEIKNDFPRITRKDLPEGVRKISYSLELDKIEKFRTNINKTI